MRVAFAVALKDLRQRMRDRTAIFIAFIAPTILASIVSSAFGGGFGPTGNANLHLGVAVADEDHSQLSNAFVTVLKSPQLKSLIGFIPATSAADVRVRVENDRAAAGYVIPKGYMQRVTSGSKATIEVIGRTQDPILRDIAAAVADGFSQQVQASRLSVFTTIRTGKVPPSLAPKLAAAASQQRMPLQVIDTNYATKDVSGANYFGPGMAMFFLFFTIGAGARSLFAEREQGTLPRILAAPATRSAILVGKGLSMFVLGLLSMTTVFVTMKVFFHVHWGDPLAIALLTVLAVLALMAVTALVQTLAKTEQQASGYGQLIAMVFSLLGGNFFPLFQMPAFVQKLAALTPNGWALRGFTDIAYDGAKAAQLLPNFAAIGAFIVVCGSIAIMNARRITLR